MARGPEHRLAGTAFGAMAAGYKAQNLPLPQLLAEMVGGGFDGRWGGGFPDILEPATSPRHRGPAHAVIPAGAVGVVGMKGLDGAQEFLRRIASDCYHTADTAETPLGQLLWEILGSLCHFAAGFAAGSLAGYGSHLLLDGFTPAGLPLLGAGR